jgi:hypothetical protein
VKRLLSMTLLMIGTMSPGRGTMAVFSSAQTSSSNVFSAATIQLGGLPVSALVTFSNVYPGATVYGNVTVENSGNADLRYAVVSSATNADGKALAEALQLDVSALSAASCTSTGFPTTTSGALYTGPLSDVTPALTELTLVGNLTSLGDASNRTLTTASPSESLCFRVALPSTAASALQGATTTVTFKFIAVQKSGF